MGWKEINPNVDICMLFLLQTAASKRDGTRAEDSPELREAVQKGWIQYTAGNAYITFAGKDALREMRRMKP